MVANCKCYSSNSYRFFFLLGNGSFERVKVSDSVDAAEGAMDAADESAEGLGIAVEGELGDV